MVREVEENELNELLKLYLHLHEDSLPEMTKHLKDTWTSIMQDENHYIIVKEVDGKIVSSCVCVIIPKSNKKHKAICFCRKCCYAWGLQRKRICNRMFELCKENSRENELL